jgi:hypothetical protein
VRPPARCTCQMRLDTCRWSHVLPIYPTPSRPCQILSRQPNGSTIRALSPLHSPNKQLETRVPRLIRAVNASHSQTPALSLSPPTPSPCINAVSTDKESPRHDYFFHSANTRRSLASGLGLSKPALGVKTVCPIGFTPFK